jgi:uncharacterized protein (TIGR03435 family)
MRHCVGAFVLVAIVFVVNVTSALPQAPPTSAFEVASIKMNIRDVPWHDTRENCGLNGMGFVNILPGGRVRAERALIPCILAGAYNLRPFQIVGGNDWVNSVHFDIEAKSADATINQERVRGMLRNLLTDRFRLKVHAETRQLPIYVLSVAKGGSKLQPPKKGSCLAPADRTLGEAPAPPPPGQPPAPFIRPCGGVGGTGAPGGSRIDGGQVPMSDLVRFLTNILRRPVIDKTNLVGIYDIHVAYAGTNTLATDNSSDTGPTLFTALEEQSGLKLESTKGPVEVLVIDHAEKPDAN